MTVTANTLIADALGMLGIVGSADTVSGNDANLGLRVLNRLLDGLKQAPHMATDSAWITFALPAGYQSMTIGPGADIDVARPVAIEVGSYVSQGGHDTPLTPVGRDAYAAIRLKDQGGDRPAAVHYEATSPTGTLYFWPTSGSGATVKLSIRSQLSTFADLTTAYALPDGYEAYLVPALAVKLAPHFERQVSPDVRQDMRSAKAAIERTNAEVPQLSMGAAATEQVSHGIVDSTDDGVWGGPFVGSGNWA